MYWVWVVDLLQEHNITCTLPLVNDCILAQSIRSIGNYECKKSQEKPIYDLFVPRMVNRVI
jgi:hypothetical protein